MLLSFGVASKSPFRGDQEGRGIAPADGTPLSKALGQLLPVQSLLPFLRGMEKPVAAGRWWSCGRRAGKQRLALVGERWPGGRAAESLRREEAVAL